MKDNNISIFIWLPKSLAYGSLSYCQYLHDSLQDRVSSVDVVVGFSFFRFLMFFFNRRIRVVLVHPSLYFLFLSFFVRRRVVVTHHNVFQFYPGRSFSYWFRFKSLLFLLHYYVNVSVSHFVAGSLPFSSKVILNRVVLDEALFSGALWEDRDFDIGFFASLRRSKGVYVLMELIRRNPDLTFVVAGSDMDGLNIESFFVDQPNVKYMGFVSRQEVGELMRNTKVVIAPSIGEPFGLTPVEAVARGARVVFADDGGLHEAMDGLDQIGLKSLDPIDWERVCRDQLLNVHYERDLNSVYQFDGHMFGQEYLDILIR